MAVDNLVPEQSESGANEMVKCNGDAVHHRHPDEETNHTSDLPEIVCYIIDFAYC